MQNTCPYLRKSSDLKGPLNRQSGWTASVSSRGGELGLPPPLRESRSQTRRASPPGTWETAAARTAAAAGRLPEAGRRPDSRRHVTSSQPPLPATQIRPRNPRLAGRARGHVATAPVPAAPQCVCIRHTFPFGSRAPGNNECFGAHLGECRFYSWCRKERP